MIDPAAWLEAYAAAWRARDPSSAAALFAPDAFYTSDPFGPGLRGPEAIRAYWEEATGAQSAIDLRLGAPLVDGERAAAEWWASFERDGAPATLAACLLLRFAPDGRCTELREYWRPAPEPCEPPAGWLATD